jgi:hypothetical protein
MSAMALDYSVDSTTEVEAAVALGAEGTIQGWRPLVAGLSQWAQRSARRAPLEDLTRRYERASGDSSFAEDPPLEGLDALTDELTEPRIYDGLWYMAGARWAIRVCEELVHWRAVRADKDAPATVRVAINRLELALTAARRHLGDEPAGSRSQAAVSVLKAKEMGDGECAGLRSTAPEA